jgi:hypothetical protein
MPGGRVKVMKSPDEVRGWQRWGSLRAMRPLLFLSLVVLSGCASKFHLFGSGADAMFRHRELGYEIAYPSVLTQPGWQTASLDESDLIVRHTDGSAWAIASTCRETLASVRVLAAELARAIGGEAVEPGEPLTHARLAGWRQRFERREGKQRLEIETVTLRGPHCTYDFVFVAPSRERQAQLEPAFDDWWKSFRPGRVDRVKEGAKQDEKEAGLDAAGSMPASLDGDDT